MDDQILRHLTQIRRTANRLVFVEGLSWFLASALSSLVAIGIVDWLFRFDGMLERLLIAVPGLAAGTGLLWMFVLRPFRHRLTTVEIAHAIEQQRPGWNGLLSSTASFLESGLDPRAGSVEMQSSLVSHATSKLHSLQTTTLFDRRRVHRALVTLSLVIIGTLGLIAINPAAAAIAAQRIASPLNARPWPRRCRLELLDQNLQPVIFGKDRQLRLADGESVVLLVRNARGPVPKDLQVEFRFPDGRKVTESLPIIQRADDQANLQSFGELQLRSSPEPLMFRVIGGDDRDAIGIGLETQQAPSLQSLTIELTPPSYTGIAPIKLSDGIGQVRVVVGSRIRWRGTVNRDLSTCSLVLHGRVIPGLRMISPREFSVEYTADQPGPATYRFEFEDTSGLSHPTPPVYPIHVIPDLPPRTRIEAPSSDQLATPSATVPIEVAMTDDFGVESAELVLHSSTNADDDPLRIPLVIESGLSHQLIHPLELNMFDAKPGQTFEFHAVSRDALGDRIETSASQSARRRIEVVSAEEKQLEIDHREGLVANVLKDATAAQNRLIDQSRDLLIQIETAGRLRTTDVDLMRRIDFDQQQVASHFNGQDSAIVELRTLELELDRNRLPAGIQKARLRSAAAALELLGQQQLPLILSASTRIRKLTELTSQELSDPRLPQSMRKFIELQQGFAESLQEIWASLNQEQMSQNLVRDLQVIVVDFENLRSEISTVIARTLTRTNEELSDQDRADQSRLASRSGSLAEAFLGWFQTLRSTPEESLDHQLREQREGIVQEIKVLAITERLADLSGLLKRNRGGSLVQQTESLSSDLRAILQLAASHQTTDLETRLRRLREIATELATAETSIRDDLQQIPNGNSVTQPRVAGAIKESVSRFTETLGVSARRLHRLGFERLEDDATAIVSGLQILVSSGRHPSTPGIPAKPAEIRDAITQLRIDLASEIKDLETQLAMDRLGRIGQLVNPIREAQQALLEETTSLQKKYRRDGRWSRATLKTLLVLAHQQLELGEGIDAIAEQMRTIPVFHAALGTTAEMARHVSRQLESRQTDSGPTGTQAGIIQRLDDLVVSATIPNAVSANSGGQGESVSQTQATTSPQLAGIRLLSRWQATIQTETLRLRADSSKATAMQFQQLADEQQQLAEILRQISGTPLPDANSNAPP